MVENCLFCKIYREMHDVLYEDECTFVIADKYPLSEGHLLVIPKVHAEFLHEMSDDVLRPVLINVKKIVVALGYKRYNVLQNNGHKQSIPHVHFHIVPATENNALLIDWKTITVDESILAQFREKVRKALN